MLRRVVISVAILLCAAAARGAEHPAVLPPIPDVGEPFDVKTFISVPYANKNSAFTTYRRAIRAYVAPQDVFSKTHPSGADLDWNSFSRSRDETTKEGWSHANADVRDWLKANQAALEIWQRGSQCADAMDIPPAEIRLGSGHHPELRDFARLAWLEAARVTVQGKPADAWTWYRGVLRSSAHIAMHNQLIGPLTGSALYIGTANFARRWAARPDLSASDLRQALADVIAVNELMPPPSDAFKCDYLTWRTKDGRLGAIDLAVPNFSPLSDPLGYNERARRTLNLVYANLLSQADLPRFGRAPIRGKLHLFGRDRLAPVSKTFYPDEEIEGKILTFAPEVKIAQTFLPPENIFDFFDQERAEQAALVLGLALQLYHREHGQFPATLAILVANGYLKSIPLDPFGKGEPFHYRRENDPHQGAVLWSVWWDGIDQQGRRDVWNAADRRTGDRIFKIEGH